MGFLTTREAGLRLGVSAARVRQLVAGGRIPARKIGRDLLVEEKALNKYLKTPRRGPGRPRAPAT
jgi:excisionase family DNA binding protein